jgi:hypothetical protein
VNYIISLLGGLTVLSGIINLTTRAQNPDKRDPGSSLGYLGFIIPIALDAHGKDGLSEHQTQSHDQVMSRLEKSTLGGDRALKATAPAVVSSKRARRCVGAVLRWIMRMRRWLAAARNRFARLASSLWSAYDEMKLTRRGG